MLTIRQANRSLDTHTTTQTTYGKSFPQRLSQKLDVAVLSVTKMSSSFYT